MKKVTPLRRGTCLVLVSPAGVGKAQIVKRLLAAEPELFFSVSVTTRPPKEGEIDGVDYFFREQEAFVRMVAAGEFLEWATVAGHSYGTPRQPIEQSLTAKQDVIIASDWQGHRQLRSALPGDVVGIFLLPTSIAEISARLSAESNNMEAIEQRLSEARSDISHVREFDNVLVSRIPDQTTTDIQAILVAARTSTTRTTDFEVPEDELPLGTPPNVRELYYRLLAAHDDWLELRGARRAGSDGSSAEIKGLLEGARSRLISLEQIPFASIGHNMPPEPLIQLETDLINPNDLIAAKSAVNGILTNDIKEASKDLIIEAESRLASVVRAVGMWIARKTDVAANEFAKTFGKSLAIAVGGVLTTSVAISIFSDLRETVFALGQWLLRTLGHL